MATKKGRPQGGNAAARPSAVHLACEGAVLRELALGPFVLPAKREQVMQWAAIGLTREQVVNAVDRLALAGRVKVKVHHAQVTVMRATSPSSTVAAMPATVGEEQP